MNVTLIYPLPSQTQAQTDVWGSPTIILFFIALAISAITWSLNEWGKRSRIEHAQKEKRYLALINCFKDYYDPKNPFDTKQFIKEFNLCLLYCPDSVIRKGNEFLKNYINDASDDEKDKAFNEFMFAIREDTFKGCLWPLGWLRKTQLKPDEIKAWAQIPRKLVLRTGKGVYSSEGNNATQTNKRTDGKMKDEK